MEWISVDEHLPPYRKNVIIYCGGKGVSRNSKGIDYGGWLTKEFGWLHSDGCKAVGVTHWMELPKPPKTVASV